LGTDLSGKITFRGDLVSDRAINIFSRLTVLDISAQSLQHAKTRLGKNSREIEWLEDDVTTFQPPHPYELWHDRAVFHFLTKAEDRKPYDRWTKKM